MVAVFLAADPVEAAAEAGKKIRFYVNSWGRAKIEKLEIVSECESSGTIFMYYRTEFFS